MQNAIQNLIDGVGRNCEQPLSEAAIRQVIKSFEQMYQHYSSEQDKLNVSRLIVSCLNQPKNVLANTVSALSFLVISQKVLLYSSEILSADRENLRSLDVYQKMFMTWREILQNQIVNAEDKFRCKFFTKLISHLSSYLSNKVQMSYEFSHYIDTGLNL